MGNVICNYWWYWLIAAAISIFQGVRGFLFQIQLCELQKINLSSDKLTIKTDIDSNRSSVADILEERKKLFVIYAKTQFQIILFRAIPYCFFFFITTLLGFVALFFVYYILNNTYNLNDISGGTAALVIFAILYGIIGITGQLPTLIEQGKLPK
jgi:uncharacterized membrane protein YqjE